MTENEKAQFLELAMEFRNWALYERDSGRDYYLLMRTAIDLEDLVTELSKPQLPEDVSE